MKLRSLTLTNVRKFAGQTATISGLGDGVNVVAQANEFGKSTFFDALHALFFLKYGAATREVKSLQPRAGGAVRVSAEIELPAGRFTLEKSFLAQKRASVRDSNGTLVALDDEAESWIAQLMGNGLEGPAGLLWVRQGITALEPAGITNKEKENLLGARRNLLSSVAGEIDMITGGRRMDRVIETAKQELSRLATASGLPKANGPWKEAELEAQSYESRHEELDRACRELTKTLSLRREVTARLAVLEAPGAQQALTDALDQAQTVYNAAQAHADKLAQADAQVALRQLELEAAQSKLDGLIKTARQFETTQAELEKARLALSDTTVQMTAAETTTDQAQQTLAHATAQLAQAVAAKEAAQQDILRQHAADKHTQLVKGLAQVEAKCSALERAKAILATLHVTPKALMQLETLQAAYARVQADAAAGGVQMFLAYDGDARVSVGAEPLDAGAHPVAERQVFDLPGIGRMTLDPSAAVDVSVVAQAGAKIQAALTDVGVPDIAAARATAAKRVEIAAEIDLLTNVIATLAPEGTGQLQADLAQASAALDALVQVNDTAQVDPQLLVQNLETARENEKAARQGYEDARDRRDQSRAAKAHATATCHAAQTSFDAANAAFGGEAAFRVRQADAARTNSSAQLSAQDARDAANALRTAAPDLATAQADLTRAKSAAHNAQEESGQLRTRGADLSATIRARAEDGIEEKRDEAAGLMQSAQERAARLAHEAAGLTLLVEALRAKRGAAQEAYFGPVQAELTPLLALLHEDAALSFDPGSMLPQGLARGGEEEEMEMLSGGTQEQIAILTRLAFARLFARQGKPMPIILDDALVYSDDSRIVAMFTALHRVAADQQVIVFSCRQMAFAELGGGRPQVDIVQDR